MEQGNSLKSGSNMKDIGNENMKIILKINRKNVFL